MAYTRLPMFDVMDGPDADDIVFEYKPENETLMIGSRLPDGRTSWYELDLDRARTAHQALDWVAHMASKTWMNRHALGRLARQLMKHGVKDGGQRDV